MNSELPTYVGRPVSSPVALCLAYFSRLGSSSGGATSPELQVVTCNTRTWTRLASRRPSANNGSTIVSR